MPQLPLFVPRVEPHMDPDDVALAARVPQWVRFGTSSWTFPGWRGIVYAGAPTPAELVVAGLGAYARHPLLRTVGIDRSYYGPLTADELAVYAAQLPSGFFAVSKVWQEATTFAFPPHARFGARAGQLNPHFLDAALVRDEVLAAYEKAFSAHAGPFVFELAPSPARPEPTTFARAVDALLAALAPRFPRFRFAFELRTRELLTPRYFDALRAHRAAHVFNYWSWMPTVGEQLGLPGALGAPFAVARLMLPPGLRYEDRKRECAPFDRIVREETPMRDDVEALARACAAMGVKALFVIVNNKAEGSAPLTIRALAHRLAALGA